MQVATELNVVPRAYHGFDQAAPKAGVSVRFKAALSSALARAFECGILSIVVPAGEIISTVTGTKA